MHTTNPHGERGRALQAGGRFAMAMVAAALLLGCAAVLGIVITAPLGAFLMDTSAPKLLSKAEE